MKGQTSTEFIITIAIVLVILLFTVSIVFDFPSLTSNIEEQSKSRRLTLEDIGIESFTFHSDYAALNLQNNLDYPIRITSIEIDSTKIHSGFLMNPHEEQIVKLIPPSSLGDFFDIDLGIEYENLVDGNTYGFTVNIDGQTTSPPTCSGGSDLYQNLVCYNNMLAYYPFDSDFNDKSGNTYHGTESGDAVINYGKLDLDGVGDYVDVSSHNINLGTNNVSISFWMTVENPWTGVTDILGDYVTGTPTSNEGVWFFGFSAGDLSFRAGSIGTIFVELRETTSADDGNWHHVVGTLERDGNMSLYLDGTLLNSIDFSSHSGGDLGHFNKIGDASGYPVHNGSIDEVLVFTDVLSAAEVEAIYAMGR